MSLKERLEGRTEVKRKRGRRLKNLLRDFKERRGHWKLKQKALDRTLGRTLFGRVYGPVVRQTTQ